MFNCRGIASAPGRRAAKASNVIWLQPLSSAKRTISGHCLAGIKPRARQVLTVDHAKPKAADTALVPPKSFKAESTVIDMDPIIVRRVRTVEGVATPLTTAVVRGGNLGPMVGPLYDPPTLVAPRLKAIRLAVGKSQVEFAQEIGVEKNTYNPWETGKRSITFEGACLIRLRFKIPVEYLFFGENEDHIPAVIYRKSTAQPKSIQK